ncbi:MAG: hypothetical protein GY934_17685, partial [Gammaproteobacteria bacterium]|nr:hypothetical protein [Gammaproteobacteria bacterium]
PVVILGDGEFDGSQVVEWFINETDWLFVCRTDKTNKVFYQDEWLALHEIPFKEGDGSSNSWMLLFLNLRPG